LLLPLQHSYLPLFISDRRCRADSSEPWRAEMINRVLGHISDLHGDFLRTVLAASSPTSGDVPPTTSSSIDDFATPAGRLGWKKNTLSDQTA
jgi:hypothetical protein